MNLQPVAWKLVKVQEASRPICFTRFSQGFSFRYNMPLLHTIRKVKFLSKNSILTKNPNIFTQNFFDNISREIKVVNS